MPIKREEVARFADESGFVLSKEEIDQLTPQLNDILAAVTVVQDVESEGIPPTENVSQLIKISCRNLTHRPSDPLTALDDVPAAEQLRFNVPHTTAED